MTLDLPLWQPCMECIQNNFTKDYQAAKLNHTYPSFQKKLSKIFMKVTNGSETSFLKKNSLNPSNCSSNADLFQYCKLNDLLYKCEIQANALKRYSEEVYLILMATRNIRAYWFLQERLDSSLRMKLSQKTKLGYYARNESTMTTVYPIQILRKRLYFFRGSKILMRLSRPSR